jgi:hypothetical protein
MLKCTKEKEVLCKNKNKICNKKTGRCNKIPDIQIINKIPCTKEKEVLCKNKNKICNKKTGRCNKIPDIQIINKIPCTKEKEVLCKNKNKICNKKTGRCNKIPDIQIISNKKKSLTTLEKISKLKKIWKKVKLNSNNNPKKKAFNIIIKHLLPFITKTFTLKNRIKYANEIHKGMFKDFNLKELKSLNIPADKFKIITKDNYYLNNIHLFKKIGSESVYGTIYNVKYKYNKYFYNICGKIMCDTPNNRKEIELIIQATHKTMNNETPHFPIMYFNSFIKKDTNLKNNRIMLPQAITKCNDFIVNFNEIFSGDLKTFLDECKHNNNKYILINTLEQIFISILTFHIKMKKSHNDCHWGNFLYHKIKPGGYIHYNIYNKDIYIKNYGYLWIIWDYGLTSELNNYNKYKDYFRILHAFISEYDKGWNNNLKYKINRVYDIKKKIINLNSGGENENILFDILFSYHTNTYIKPQNNEIINLNNPYILN